MPPQPRLSAAATAAAAAWDLADLHELESSDEEDEGAPASLAPAPSSASSPALAPSSLPQRRAAQTMEQRLAEIRAHSDAAQMLAARERRETRRARSENAVAAEVAEAIRRARRGGEQQRGPSSAPAGAAPKINVW